MSARFVVAGEALVDIVVPREGERALAPGGSPLNVAVGLSRLGVDTVLLTTLGDDDLGRLVRDHVEGSGVRLGEGSVTDRPTSTATAHLDAAGAATYDFDLAWELPAQSLPADASGLHVGSIGAVLRPGRDAVVALVRAAADRDLLVTFDPNMRPAFTPDAAAAWRDVTEVAALAQVVKLSDEDLEFLRPGAGFDDVAAELLTGRTQVVVMTKGGSGALARSREAAVEVASAPTSVVDTVGAGDSFMAALVAVAHEHGVATDEETLRAHLTAAHEAASVTVGRRGADPPTRAELGDAWPRLP